MNAITPIASIIPENAPFSTEQRAWLNGFFAAYLGVGGEAVGRADAAFEPGDDFPWHDASLAMPERLELAKGAKPARQLMAAMAQLDCGQCGYLCQTYAEAVWSGSETDIGRCVPGGKETQRKLKELLAALEPGREGAPAAPAAKPAAPVGSRDRPALATLVDAHPLNRPGSGKDVRHVVLDLSATDLTYEAGDSLGVFARKNPQLVQAVLDRVGATGEEMVAFDGEALPLRQVLLSKLDIARPSDECMEFLATRAFDGEEALKLQALARGEGPAELAEADLLDLLMAFPSVMPSLPGLLKSLDRLQPRLYSIASSSKAHPREVHLTVSAVRWDSNQRTRTGIGSCYLADFAKPGDVIPIFVQKSHGFGPPADDSAAAIMVGPGTGIAPFRAFLEEREARGAASGKKGGRNWLFFGDQKRLADFLYEDQIMDWQRRGVLHRLDLAFSRDQAEKIYVQNRMQENAVELWQWLEEGAHFYVCGDAKRMAKDVEETLLAIAVEQGGKSAEQAKAWLDGLAKAGADVVGDPDHPANRGRICSKGAALGETLSLEDRLLHPEVDGRRVSWDTALDTVADGFREIVAHHGPDAVAFYVSGQLLTEDYYAANKLIKGFLGTANIDTNSRLCMASSVAGHKRAFGSDTVPGLYEDFELADLVVLVGSNLAWCHPVLFQRLDAAKRARPAMRIVVVDPRRTETCDIADLHLGLRPGSDVALFNVLLAELQRRGATAKRFVDKHTVGVDDALIAARASDVGQCDLAKADLRTFFDWFAKTERTVTLYSQGVNQSSAGADKVNALINCHLLTGRIGRPGMGPFSITGQPNAMGGREVGALSNALAAHMDFALEDVGRVGRFWNTDRVARKPGLKAVELFEAVRAGRIKAVWIMATNPVASLPNADAVREALAACELSVVSEAVRASDTVDACRVRLPALAWAEKNGTVTNSERGISRQRPFLPAPGEARQDWWIIAEVARRLGHGEAFAWKSVAGIFREHASLSAFENDGQRDFDIGSYADVDDGAYETMLPFVWPARRNSGPTWTRFFADGGFFHSDGRARFIATAAREPVHAPSGEWPIRLNTGRVRDQWHTMTRTAKSPRLAGHRPEPAIELNAIDAAQRGLQDGDIAEVTSKWGRAVLRVHLSTALRQGEAFAPMHWTAQLSRAGRINAAVNPAVDPLSGQPELKHTPVEIRRVAVQWHGTILARRPVMLPEITYWARIRGAGYHAYLLAGEQPLAAARHALSAAMRTTNPGPWLDGEDCLGAVISDGRLEAVLGIGAAHDAAVRDRLAPFMAMGKLDAEQRRILLHGGDAGDNAGGRGGEVCACHGVSFASVQAAIANGAMTLDAVGAATEAGTSCGSCRPEIRALLRAARPRQTA